MLSFEIDYSYVSERAKKLSKDFNLHFNEEKLPSLLAKGRIGAHVIELYKILKQAIDATEEECDIQFEFGMDWQPYTNEYGHNEVMQGMFFKRFVVSKVHLVIHYPEITITNSRKQSVEIKDLFVKYVISVGRTVEGISNLMGMRTTVSIPEYLAKYEHSHLRSKDFSNEDSQCAFNNFCVGDGKINVLARLAIADGDLEEMDVDDIVLLIHNIRTFVEWESLEGTPHIKMAAIQSKSFELEEYEGNDLSSFCQMAIRRIVTKDIPLKLNWRFRDGQYFINDDEALEELFRNIFNDNSPLLYNKTETGQYFRLSAAAEVLIEGLESPVWVPFKGQKFFFKVIGNNLLKGSDTKYIHPKIKQYVKQRIEYYTNSYKTKQAGVKRISASLHR